MYKIKTILGYAFGIFTLISLIGLAEKKQSDRLVNDLNIDILEKDGNYFIDRIEVAYLINAKDTDYVLGLSLDQLDLKVLEERLEQNAFVKDAQVFIDIKGNLKVKLEQAKPIARILSRNGKDRYIDDEGNLLPLNAKYTARVPILEIEKEQIWEHSILENKIGIKLFDMLMYIESDPFWKPQIAHLILDKREEITMLPQITKQEIIFGKPEDIDSKFKKLKLFYKEILPNKGWNTYEYVNVKFKNQIVCK